MEFKENKVYMVIGNYDYKDPTVLKVLFDNKEAMKYKNKRKRNDKKQGNAYDSYWIKEDEVVIDYEN